MTGTLTETQRRELAGRARTLHERLEGVSNVSGDGPQMEPTQIVNAWREQFSNEQLFQRRLEEEGLTEAEIRAEVAATRWPESEPLPDWIATIDELIEHVEGYSATEGLTVPGSDEQPFEELLAAVLEFARDRLPALPVRTDAVESMVEGLGARIQSLWVRVMYIEFKTFVHYHDPELADTDPDAISNPPRTHYEEFLDTTFGGGFEDICLEYPVLARQLALLIEHWTGSVVELCRRLEADRSAIEAEFDVEGEVIALEPLADDSHARGRLPVRVSFESGEVVYKPREVDGGIAFFTILDRLSDHLPLSAFYTPSYVSKDGYGWMEFVEAEDPADEAAATRYYEHAGAVLCVAYALNFTDINLENLIVDGDQPMLIDGETLFHPHLDPDAKPMTSAHAKVHSQSVLSTGTLPVDFGYQDGEEQGYAAFVGGFGTKSEPVTIESYTIPSLEAINTDVMTVTPEHPEIDATTNTPSVDGTDHPPADHIYDLVRGFSKTYDRIVELRDEGRFFSEVVDSELVDGIENRLIYRDTLQYRGILLGAVGRDSLRSGARLTLDFERLALPYVSDQIELDSFWELYEAERTALRRRDVPRFTSRPRRRTVYHDGEPIELSIAEAGYERSRQRVDAMNPTDKRRQISLIRQSYRGVWESFTKPKPPAVETTDERLRQNACDLFDDVIDAAITLDDEREWVSFLETSPVNMVSGGPDLYYGRGGIGLTAVALYRVTGRQRYRRLATDVFDRIVDEYATGKPSQPVLGLGMRGNGAVLYALSVASDLLDEDRYRDAARTVARTVDESKLAVTGDQDILEGTAGELLGLLAYHDRFADPDILDRAVTCGERLLDAAVDVGEYRAWTNPKQDAYPVTGFAHGTSGIAYALARLAAKADDERYARAALDGIAFEDDPTVDQISWETLHGADDLVPEWCHGHAGDALVRMSIGEYLDDESMRADAKSHLRAAESLELNNVNGLCCGNMARIEAFLAGSRRFDERFGHPRWLAGLGLASRERGQFGLAGHTQLWPNVSLFDGLSGVTYTLLRLHSPDELPSVLLFE